jgi:hypothetical protein
MECSYTTYCQRVTEDESEFKRFKSDQTYCSVVQTVSYWEGRLYLREIEEDYPDLIRHFDSFKKIDSIGNPKLFSYGRHGNLAPTMLRYTKVLGDLTTLFGDLSGLRVVEIGCGYGGQCALLKTMFNISSYTLVDLTPVLRLTEKCLTRLELADNVQFLTMDQLPEGEKYDLFISNYAFTELSRDIQDVYWEKTVRGTTRGYLTFNSNDISYPKEELLRRLEHPRVFEERPQTADNNCIITWGADLSTAGLKQKTGQIDRDRAKWVMLQHFGFIPLEEKKVVRRKEVKVYAAKGNSQAMFDLGLMNYFEQFMGGNPSIASEWFQRAAETGSIDAQKFLGIMYFSGDGVPCDRKQAVNHFRNAAEAGDSRTQILLGRMLLTGEGVERNEGEAVHWLNRAEPSMDEGVRSKLKCIVNHAN